MAQAWVLGGDVLVADRVCSKPGTLVAEDVPLELRRPLQKYVSRGGLKLEAALARFGVPVADRVVLDAGASTGGFTDCLLQHGARRVYAVDVGYGQLRGKLASEPRVTNLERTNISDLAREDLSPAIDLCVFDLSYLSARKAVPVLASLFQGPPEMVGLIKPLFEGVSQSAMQDSGRLASALLSVLESLGTQQLSARDAMVSPIFGTRGTVEFLVWIVAGPTRAPMLPMVQRAIAEISPGYPSPEGV
jgi:23S rRNA (cytidine1920-2'-O)/16S rRNA (cytidine1409-2'-O)-methyltransferase